MDTWTQASTKTVNGLEKRQYIIQSKSSRQRNSLRKLFCSGKIENCSEGGLSMDVRSRPELIWYKETRAVNALSKT